MPRNFYFNNFRNSSEQQLIDDLIVESIRIHGVDVWYIARHENSFDEIMNEDDNMVYDKALLAEMYIKTYDSFGGDGDFISKFGLQINDTLVLTIAISTFNKLVGKRTGFIRPREGDLVYLPMNRKIFQIMHVEHESIFYQMGDLQVYDLKCELFEFNNEVFRTGVPEIDKLLEGRRIKTTTTIDDIKDIDPFADNLPIEQSANTLIDFTADNLFGDDIF